MTSAEFYYQQRFVDTHRSMVRLGAEIAQWWFQQETSLWAQGLIKQNVTIAEYAAWSVRCDDFLKACGVKTEGKL